MNGKKAKIFQIFKNVFAKKKYYEKIISENFFLENGVRCLLYNYTEQLFWNYSYVRRNELINKENWLKKAFFDVIFEKKSMKEKKFRKFFSQ